jgi:hypothetical protein
MVESRRSGGCWSAGAEPARFRPSRALACTVLLGSLLAAPRAEALCARPGDPDCLALRDSFRGTLDFFATGASFTFDDDTDDRPDGLIDVAEVTVPSRRIPARANLKRAFLYFGGSLYADGDGNDAPDETVELQLPGTTAFQTVRGEQVYRSGPIAGFENLTLYTVRADVTELMQTAGAPLTGTYRVRGFDADIFDGALEHTAANASFSIVLIFEEPRLPPRSIVLFDGMQEVLGSTVSLDLSGFIVSQVPSGTLTLYAQEGDCNPGPGDCANGDNKAGLERVRIRSADGGRSLVLSDGVNPANDIFNRTINTVDPPLTNVPGTDIDRFDISQVLRPGDTAFSVEITTPRPRNGASGELVGLAYVVVGIDVFAPEFREDSRIEIRTERGEQLDAYYPGDPLRVVYALSNTGNLPGSGVQLTADLPEVVTRFEVLSAPTGSSVEVDPRGGAAGRGRVTVRDARVRHGEADDLVLLVETACPLVDGGALGLTADVGAAVEGSIPFTMTASVALIGRDRCGPRFFLYGGGGCRALGPVGGEAGRAWGVAVVGLALLLRIRRRARRSVALVAALALFTLLGCGDEPGALPDRGSPTSLGFVCPNEPEMVVVPAIGGLPPFCIDQYEARVVGAIGNAEQPIEGDGSTTGRAQSARFQLPTGGVTWFQARAACVNAGKRLCSGTEWAAACSADAELTYPYGNEYGPTTCNGFDANRGAPVESGAMLRAQPGEDGLPVASGCVSRHGAYDLSGNLWEWNADPHLDGRRRGIAGGGFRSNRAGLRCVTEDSHAEPTEQSDAFGFRCCKDFPSP